MRPVLRFLRHRWADRFLLLEAFFWLAVARLAMLSVSFGRIAPLLGRHMGEFPGGGRSRHPRGRAAHLLGVVACR